MLSQNRGLYNQAAVLFDVIYSLMLTFPDAVSPVNDAVLAEVAPIGPGEASTELTKTLGVTFLVTFELTTGKTSLFASMVLAAGSCEILMFDICYLKNFNLHISKPKTCKDHLKLSNHLLLTYYKIN